MGNVENGPLVEISVLPLSFCSLVSLVIATLSVLIRLENGCRGNLLKRQTYVTHIESALNMHILRCDGP